MFIEISYINSPRHNYTAGLILHRLEHFHLELLNLIYTFNTLYHGHSVIKIELLNLIYTFNTLCHGHSVSK